jgi:hypothetical protein
MSGDHVTPKKVDGVRSLCGSMEGMEVWKESGSGRRVGEYE